MTEELQILWSLRALDEQCAGVKEALGRLPGQRRQLDEQVSSERVHLDALKARVAELQKVRRDRERDIEAAREQERRFQGQLPAVKKNEEYTALLHEIDGVKSKRSEMETEVLLQLDEEEKMQKERPALEQSLKAAEDLAAERRGQLDREEREQRERLEALEAERVAHLGRLGPATRQRYERIHGSRNGRAVVAISKGACGGCFRGQPPQTLQEARRGDRLLVCDGCGRLMIWPPEGA